MKTSKLLSAILALLAGVAAARVMAADYELRNFGARTPSTQELIDALKMPEQKMRSIEFKVAKPKAVSMQVNFAFDSSALTDDAKEILDHVGEALVSDQLRDDRFRIEGYTDSTGSRAYNQRLSERRARAVRRYLTQHFDLNRSRLTVVGKGENDLLDPEHPDSGVNRRVQIVNLGEG